MKASPEDQALLLDLQAIDTKLQQLDHKARGLPQIEILRGLAEESAALRVTVAEQSGAREDVLIELKRLESDVSVVEARIIRDSDRLQVSSSVKDVQALEQELAALRKRQFDLEEIELTIMEKLEERESALQATMSRLAAVEAQVQEVEAARDTELAEVSSERAHAATNRSTIASRVPADLLALYEKQRARYGTGASHLRYGVSSANGVKFLENEMQELRAAAPDDVILCPSSDAILVRTKESGL